jgi:asparagine synthase (glutamine-hydrolysing)
MCGIGGWVGPRDLSTLLRMSDALAHRGPDGAGTWYEYPVSLCHRRLSIIDLAGGSQPMSTSDERLVIVFNGEIYNYRELRRELQQQGRQFRTQSDTEVLLSAFDAWGPGCLTRLNGMFAFAIYNRRDRLLFLAADPFGEKPLYYLARNREFVFASGLRAMRMHGAASTPLDVSSLGTYFLFNYVPAPHTIYRDVRKLGGGQYLVVNCADPDRLRVEGPHSYWTPRFEPKLPLSMDEARVRFQDLFRESVRLRLTADVPVGIFLSGGIDSTAAVAFAAELSRGRLKTFCLGIGEPSYNESQAAARVAAHFGTEHSECKLAPPDACGAAVEAIASLDEPLADDSVVPTYFLSRHARRSVKVVLGGDGGDELLAGYDFFLAHRLFPFYARLPSGVRHAARALASSLPKQIHARLDHKLPQFLESDDLSLEQRYQLWLGACAPDRLQHLFNFKVISSGDLNDRFPLPEKLTAECDLDRLIHLYLRLNLQCGILVKVDRTSMAHGLEVRSPFLDVHLADFVNRLAPALKFRGMTRKRLLREVLRSRLPAPLIVRRKQGFALPASEWLRGSLRQLAETTLNTSRLSADGIFNPKYVRAVMDQHFSGAWGHRRLIWALLTFPLWTDAQRNVAHCGESGA